MEQQQEKLPTAIAQATKALLQNKVNLGTHLILQNALFKACPHTILQSKLYVPGCAQVIDLKAFYLSPFSQQMPKAYTM